MEGITLPPLSPWALYGVISGAGAGITVTATNGTTGETQTEVTASDSSFLIDAANFTSGYADGDIITVSTPGYPEKTAEIDLTAYPEGIGVYVSKPSPFDVFAWPYRLKKSIVIPGYTSQSTGEWVAEVSSDMIITGHVSDITAKELAYLDPGLFTIGDRKISLDKTIGLNLGDYVKITEGSDGEETTWYAKSKQAVSMMMSKHAGSLRETFLLTSRQ